MGALEETAKAAGGVIDALRGSPVALAMGIMNIALLLFLFYYLTRITARTETTVASLFQGQDKLFTQWGTIIKDTNLLTEKTMHCILPEDAIKLLTIPPRQNVPEPQRPAAPGQLRWPADGIWPEQIPTQPHSPAEALDQSKPVPMEDPPKAVEQ